ncbi:MAG: ASPIC/UnbV domain-containing protein, partial [Planctomycetota bacterium]
RLDLVVGHLGERTAVLVNHTEVEPDRWIGIQLVATQSHRDAVGASVTVNTDQRSWVMQRVGGDGYYVTHEPTLRATLQAGESLENVQIRWPSGATEQLSGSRDGVSAGAIWRVIEGQGGPVRMEFSMAR